MLYKKYSRVYVNYRYKIFPYKFQYYFDGNYLKSVAVEIRVYQVRKDRKFSIFAEINGLKDHQDLLSELISDLEKKDRKKGRI